MTNDVWEGLILPVLVSFAGILIGGGIAIAVLATFDLALPWVRRKTGAACRALASRYGAVEEER